MRPCIGSPFRGQERISFLQWERLPSLDACVRHQWILELMTHSKPVRLETAPTGGRKPGYRHVAPLGLNKPTNLFPCRSEHPDLSGFARIGHSILQILKS